MELNRNTLQDLQTEMLAALADVAQRHGVKFGTAGGSIDPVRSILKISVTAADVKAAKETAKAQFKRYAVVYDAEPAWFDKTFTMRGSSYTISGIAPGRSKNCIQIRRADGKTFVCPPSTIRAHLS